METKSRFNCLFFFIRISLILTTIVILQMPCLANAAIFTVNTTTDTVDISPGDGVCADGIGFCSLRAAIQEANGLSGADVIDLPAGTYLLSMPGSGEQAGDLDITDHLEIIGQDKNTTVVDGGGIDRVFLIGTQELPVSNIVVSLSNVSITNGQPGFKNGGGIFSQNAIVTINNVIIFNNISGVDGGGIHNTDGGSMTIINSTLKSNEAGSGGAIISWSPLTVSGTTITGNKASGPGGGICAYGQLRVVNSTISGNTAGDSGGGIFSSDYSPQTIVVIKSSTVSGNTSLYDSGAIAVNYDLDIENTLISENLPTNCTDSRGTLHSLGNNLDDDGTCRLNASRDLNNVNPLIDSLQDNGGPTETHALLEGSPAIDAGPQNCTDAEGNQLLIDQRGMLRPVDGDGNRIATCDIGSFEFPAKPPSLPVSILSILLL